MKSLVFVFLFLCFTQDSFAQSYHPFPVENARWTNQDRSYELDQWFFPTYTLEWVNNFCANGNDTTLNNVNYKQLELCDISSSSYFGALRYDVGQVFYVPRDSISEFLLYDFTLDSGDTANVIMLNGSAEWPSIDFSMIEAIVQGVDTVTVNGTERRRLDFGGSTWIEGIGNTYGLFMEPWINVSMYFRELMCVSDNDTIVYDNFAFPQHLEIGHLGTCGLTLDLNEQAIEELSWTVFPNPSNGHFTINTASESGVLSVYSLTGVLIHESIIQDSETDLSLNKLGNGVYIIQYANGRSVSTKRLVITE